MMLLGDVECKHVERRCWSRQWVSRREERRACHTVFKELAIEDSGGFAEYMRMPHCKFILVRIFGSHFEWFSDGSWEINWRSVIDWFWFCRSALSQKRTHAVTRLRALIFFHRYVREGEEKEVRVILYLRNWQLRIQVDLQNILECLIVNLS